MQIIKWVLRFSTSDLEALQNRAYGEPPSDEEYAAVENEIERRYLVAGRSRPGQQQSNLS